MAFQRRGAKVVSAEAIEILPLIQDPQLDAATRSCAARPPEILIATTGIGFRAWMESADAVGIGETLRHSLADTEIIARGPKAAGAVRAAGLPESWQPGSESLEEVISHLEQRELSGCRIAIQLDGAQSPRAAARLREAGAEVVPIPVYRCLPPREDDEGCKLVEACIAGQVDALVFTSAPGAASLLRVARDHGLHDELRSAMRKGIASFCVGPVCATPLRELDVPVVLSSRGRLGALIRTVEEHLPQSRTIDVRIGSHSLQIRGHMALLDGTPTALSPTSMAVLRSLARRPGRVLSREELAAHLPARGGSSHAVEMAVTRLRRQLGDPAMVETVFKRGYRLQSPTEGSAPAGQP